MQPADQKGWAGASAATLNQTKAHVGSVYKTIQQLSAGEAESDNQPHPGKAVWMPDTSSLEHRITEGKEASKKCREVIHQMQLMRKNQYGFLTRCEQRLDLRLQRPPTELFNDKLQEALDNEKAVISESRQKLKDQEAQLMQVVTDIDSVLVYLVREVTKKRKHANSAGLHKSVSLPSISKPGSPGGASASGRPPTTPAAGSQSLTLMPCREDPGLKGLSCDELMKCAQQREAAASPACKRSKEVMQRLSDEHTRATERVNDCLDKRVAELGDMKSNLLAQQAEADVAIYEMEKFINRVKRVNQSGDTPESEAKQAEKVKKAQEAFEQIKSSRQKLAEDIRYKARALQIDESCKILTLTKVQLVPRLRRKKGTGGNDCSLSGTNTTMKPASAPNSPIVAATPNSPPVVA
jgi:hypothetical protein